MTSATDSPRAIITTPADREIMATEVARHR
jgi:hypothetical protein